jgi:hypothetical protein
LQHPATTLRPSRRVAIAHTAERRQRSLRSLAQNHALQGGETYRTENAPLKAFVSRFVTMLQ